MKTIQELLNQEAKTNSDDERIVLHEQIKQMRGTSPPVCHGEDDCSSIMLCQCPWRIDCGTT